MDTSSLRKKIYIVDPNQFNLLKISFIKYKNIEMG